MWITRDLFFFLSLGIPPQTDECHVICCELLNGYSLTLGPNFVIVSGIMLNLENTRVLWMCHLLYNHRKMSF